MGISFICSAQKHISTTVKGKLHLGQKQLRFTANTKLTC